MSQEPVKILGCEVSFHDDKKGKWQSIEATIEVTPNVSDLNGFANLSATGYGRTEEEALKDLRAIVDRLINA